MNQPLNANLRPRRTVRRQSISYTAKAVAMIVSRLLTISMIVSTGLVITADRASAQTWSLTKAQRQAYLNYYAPVILKRGDENNSKQGRDWLTNYDFDQDGDFSNNRVNWRNINQYVAAAANCCGGR